MTIYRGVNIRTLQKKGIIPYRERFYERFYYCGKCVGWVSKETAVLNDSGRVVCPKCHAPLRLKPRNKKRRVKAC